MSMQASCQCNLHTLEIPFSAPVVVYICHCTECRRQSGSAFGMSAIFPTFDFRNSITVKEGSSGVMPDSIKEYMRVTADGKEKRGWFCGTCGSRLVHEIVSGELGAKGFITVKAGALQGLTSDMVKNATHIWTKSAVMEIPEGVKKWEGNPQD